MFLLHSAHRFAEKSMILIDAIFHHRSPLWTFCLKYWKCTEKTFKNSHCTKHALYHLKLQQYGIKWYFYTCCCTFSNLSITTTLAGDREESVIDTRYVYLSFLCSKQTPSVNSGKCSLPRIVLIITPHSRFYIVYTILKVLSTGCSKQKCQSWALQKFEKQTILLWRPCR